MSANQEKLNEQLLNVVLSDKDSDEVKLKKVKYLVRLGADVNTRLYGKSVLSKAIEKEAGAEVTQFLREKGANEWVIPKEEALELSRAFWDVKGDLKSLEEIKELLKKGADVNASDKYGETALIYVASNGYLEVVEYLVENGADLEAKEGDGQTALFRAASWGKLDVVKCLVECGADVEAKDEDSWTALDIAKDRKRDDCVKFLEEYQKKVSSQKTKGDKTSGAQIVKANGGR